MSLAALRGRRVGIWGLGIEGREAIRLLRPTSELVVVEDDVADQRSIEQAAAELGLERRPAASIGAGELDLVVRSPGVSRYRTDVVRLEQLGVESRCLTALWLDDQRPDRVIGVTGTKGKSTTSALCAALLRASGIPAVHAGNLGVPPTRAPDDELVVLEVSSYQAADVRTSPRVAALTMLAPDHHERHGEADRYARDKVRLLAHDSLSTAVLGPTVDPAWGVLDGIAPAATVTRADTTAVLGRFDPDGRVLANPALAPHHMQDNLAVAVLLASAAADVTPGIVSSVIDAFEGLPHRMQTIGERGGVTYVDDSLASNPTAAIAGLAAACATHRRVVVIVGGLDRGVPNDGLVAALRERRDRAIVVLTGAAGRRLRPELDGAGVDVAGYEPDFESAAKLAIDRAERGDAVLFSPAAPTPTSEGNYETRSALFADLALGDPRGAG